MFFFVKCLLGLELFERESYGEGGADGGGGYW